MALGISYRKEIRRAKRRVATGSKMLETRVGPIEYAEAGNVEGPPVLVIHGAGGGFDQRLDLAAGVTNEFRIIAISRFGYLRTPLPKDASPAAQADAHAAVLDALHIPRSANQLAEAADRLTGAVKSFRLLAEEQQQQQAAD